MVDYAEVFNLTKKFTILYIEDNISFLQETNEIFEDLFFRVDTATNGKEGLEKYISNFQTDLKHYDIVITDIVMPRMDGVELIKEIYKTNKDQAIIVVSAHNEAEYLLELVNIGIEQFLTKPIDFNTLLKVLYSTSSNILKSSKNDIDTGKIELKGNFLWEKESSLLFFNKENIKLTKNEMLLMRLFVKNRYKISTLEEILNIFWSNNPHLTSAETLKPIISRLRKKIPGQTIENVYGVGYRLLF